MPLLRSWGGVLMGGSAVNTAAPIERESNQLLPEPAASAAP
jgi:hypothetical protein